MAEKALAISSRGLGLTYLGLGLAYLGLGLTYCVLGLRQKPSDFWVSGLIGCQLSLCASQTSDVGGYASGSSSEAVVMSIVSGWRPLW